MNSEYIPSSSVCMPEEALCTGSKLLGTDVIIHWVTTIENAGISEILLPIR